MNDNFDNYEIYEQDFDPMNYDRQARRKRKPKVKHIAKKSQQQIIAEIADTTGIEGGFKTTYTPAQHEELWLLESVRSFYQQALITDILAQVKGGKEASVYRCQAHHSTNEEFFAAKVYRPRMFRNLRNDKMYREGRAILKSDGKEVKGSDHRILRAVGKKSNYGAQVSHTSWLMYEYKTLQTLYTVGGAVPQPYGVGENAILMSYHGDDKIAAPTLSQIDLEPDEARTIFEEVLRNIELMLQHNLVHGDLSAYNILYWQGKITVIDFPQVTNIDHNSQAKFILQRDVQRICDYFAGQDVDCDADSLFADFWQQYGVDEEYFEYEEDEEVED